jgi:CRISPR-associated endonuclease Cas1
MNSGDTLYGRIRNRVLTISGNSPSIRVDGGCLVVSDGPMPVPTNHRGPAPPANERMAVLRLPRAGCPTNRIVVTRPDGFITFGAIRWLHGVGCALVQLDRDGTVLLATAPAGPDRPAIRRAQALAAGDKTGLAIMREILRCKLAGQARVARLLGGEEAAALIDRLASEIANTWDGAHILAMEAMAATVYWNLWLPSPVQFARRHEAPKHWQTFGTRGSPLTGKPFRAATPGNALLNYLYAILESELTIALIGTGLDSGIGIFHLDKDRRASLSLDAMEAARPYVDAWLAHWLADARFAKRDFFEEDDGAVLITRPLTSHLAMTAPLWRRAAITVAGWLAQSFAQLGGRNQTGEQEDRGAFRHRKNDPGRNVQPLPPPLPVFSAPARTYHAASLKNAIPRACHECGRELAPKQRKFCSNDCASAFHLAMRRLIPITASGPLLPSLTRERSFLERRSETLRRAAAERRAWDMARDASLPQTRPGGAETRANDKLRRWYHTELQPRLAALRPIDIARAIDLSHTYAAQIVAGQVPHPRHFAALAKLAGVAAPKALKLAPIPAQGAAAGEPQSTAGP